jgi:hypothetical protein
LPWQRATVTTSSEDVVKTDFGKAVITEDEDGDL